MLQKTKSRETTTSCGTLFLMTNDANLGAVTNDDENEKVFLVNVIQLKGVA